MLADAADLADGFQIAAALSLEGFAANLSPVHPVATRMRPHVGQITAARRLRELLEGSPTCGGRAPRATSRTRSPSAAFPRPTARSTTRMSYARGTMEIELNSAGDNPLVATEDETILSVGNFDVVALAIAFDLLRLGLAQRHTSPTSACRSCSGATSAACPPGLAAQDGPTGGLRPLGRSLAALAAEARFLANPASLDYRGQLAEGIEDHASMAPLSVRKTFELVSLGHRIIALELIVAAQAIDLRGCGPLGRGTRGPTSCVRECVPRLVDETAWAADVDRLVDADRRRRALRPGGRRRRRTRAAVGLRGPGGGRPADRGREDDPADRADGRAPRAGTQVLERLVGGAGRARGGRRAAYDRGARRPRRRCRASTTYRLADGLERHGLLAREGRAGVTLGLRVLALARRGRGPPRRDAGRAGPRVHAPPGRRPRRDRAAHRARRPSAIGLASVESRQPVRLSYRAGARPRCTAAPRARSCWPSPTRAAERVLATVDHGVTASGDPVDPEALERELDEARERGYVVTHGELDAGTSGVAAPVLDPRGRLLAGLTLVGPTERVGPSVERLSAAVHTAAEAIGRAVQPR